MIDLFSIFNLESYFSIATKIFFILCSLLYFIFALVVVKQVTSMSKSVKDKYNQILIIFSFIHLLFSLLLIIMMIAL